MQRKDLFYLQLLRPYKISPVKSWKTGFSFAGLYPLSYLSAEPGTGENKLTIPTTL